MPASLFERLGGQPGIAALVDDIMAAHLSNPVVSPRFHAIKDLERAKEMARQFFAAGSGGAVAYQGRDMRAAHAGMNISEQEYLAAMDDIMAALAKHGMSDDTKKDVLAILYSLKGEIIRV